MTLQVSFEQFVESAQRLLGQKEAFVSAHESGSLVTSAKPEKAMVVAAITTLNPDQATQSLKDLGMSVFAGTWLTPEEVMSPVAAPRETFIASVSYRSSSDKPGLWVDAYPSLPTQMTVLKTMYEEFRETGEVDDVTFEEFVQYANPNVVIVSPSEIESFLRQKVDC